MESNSVCEQNRTTAKRKSDLLIKSMITDRIGRHDVLLPINQNYDKIWEKKLDIGDASYKKSQQQQWTRRNAGQQRARMTRSVHSHRYDVLIIPLTVLFHRPIRRVPTVIRDLKQSGRKSQGRLRLKNKFLFLIRILKMAAFVYRLIRRHTSTSA